MNAVKLTDDSFAERCSNEFEHIFGCRVEFHSSYRDMAYTTIEGLDIVGHRSFDGKGISFMESGTSYPNEIKTLYDLGQAFKRLENRKEMIK